MNSRPLRQRSAHLIAAAMCVLAIAAVAITIPAVLAARRHLSPLPVAPGLAALSDEQLAALLPNQSDFPAGWKRNDSFNSRNTFGYATYHNIGSIDGYEPVGCYEVAYGIMTGSFPAATVNEHDPADRSSLPDHTNIGIEIGRQFAPSVFDDMRQLVARCAHFRDHFPGFTYTVRILEDSRPAGGPQRFRYNVTITDETAAAVTDGKRAPPHVISTDYFSYAQISGLILSGSDDTGDEHRFDALFDATQRRTQAAEQSR
ncbi:MULTISPECIES: hypothetical protein [Mycobacterium]|uniref:Uncharacterized protein n=3 Tax=Mycobacterium TaxID=1763 RepID=A0A1X1XX63_9MYCO|nr:MULTISPECIES: hypothetical protein [Mycobacterium]ORW03452.1 hypothetical protein AWC14_05170 [Mycobacterium kyorinense]PBJ38735.1 hypothetical protein XV03_04465 [Mycobacterium avium subsp. hominissuis]PBJ66901.1 hypothetical protein BB737_05115 [Mycobacterium avium subsp. hominissuis]QWY65449.1 hypothetical protein BJP78_27730 [Mycobacterium avium subsp. hominissuis]